ncbi:MAG: 6-phosphogluconolactonase [Sphingomonadales bacterium]|jgi:6-phosphogluconolactonase
MTKEYLDFENAEALADRAAQDIASALHEAVSAKGRATLVAAGGSTPQAIYERLSKKFLPWDRIFVILGDERWVDMDHPLSNEEMVKKHLKKNEARNVSITGLKTPQDTPYDAKPQVEARIRDMKPPFDIVMLGMGMDGHTASLFPGDPFLPLSLDPEGEANCAAIHPDPMPAEAPVLRMTMTVKALLNTHKVMLFVSGAEKLKVLKAAEAGDNLLEMPVRAILQQKKTDLLIYRAK